MKEVEFVIDINVSPRRPWYQMSVRKLLVVIFGACCALGLLMGLLRALEGAREAARRSQCICNYCQITLALHNYHETYGSFPSAHVDDANGRPMHSWRVLLLPFMEQSALYNMYNMSEPWNSPANIKLLKFMPNIFNCPTRHVMRPGSTFLTSYVLVCGPHTVFPDGGTVKIADITDGTSNTVFAVEVDNVDIPWTEPRDLDVRTMSFKVNDPKRAGVSSLHPGGANVGFADGSKRFMHEGITPGELRALFTIDAGETIDVEAALSRQ